MKNTNKILILLVLLLLTINIKSQQPQSLFVHEEIKTEFDAIKAIKDRKQGMKQEIDNRKETGIQLENEKEDANFAYKNNIGDILNKKESILSRLDNIKDRYPKIKDELEEIREYIVSITDFIAGISFDSEFNKKIDSLSNTINWLSDINRTLNSKLVNKDREIEILKMENKELKERIQKLKDTIQEKDKMLNWKEAQNLLNAKINENDISQGKFSFIKIEKERIEAKVSFTLLLSYLNASVKDFFAEGYKEISLITSIHIVEVGLTKGTLKRKFEYKNFVPLLTDENPNPPKKTFEYETKLNGHDIVGGCDLSFALNSDERWFSKNNNCTYIITLTIKNELWGKKTNDAGLERINEINKFPLRYIDRRYE